MKASLERPSTIATPAPAAAGPRGKAMRAVAAALLAALVLAAPLQRPAAAAQTIKLGTLAPDRSPWHNVIRDMAEAWKAESGGEVRLRIYAGGIAGDEADMVRKIRIGQLHAAALSGEGLSKIASEVQALQMPMMFRSDEELAYVRGRVGPEIEAILESRGFKVLTWGDAGWVRFFAASPVIHPDDLKPMRLFVWAGETANFDAWKSQGYRPVALPATEIHTALQSGLINAFSTTPVAALSFQWFGLANHMTDLKWAPLVGAVVISTRAWNRIAIEIRPRLLRASRAAGKRLSATMPRLGAEAVRVMKKHGLKVHRVPPEAAKEWARRARLSYPTLVGQIVPAAMVARVERIRDEYRAQKAR